MMRLLELKQRLDANGYRLSVNRIGRYKPRFTYAAIAKDYTSDRLPKKGDVIALARHGTGEKRDYWQMMEIFYKALDETRKPQPDIRPKFEDTFCSQCGRSFGPGDHGYSHCHTHMSENH